MGRNVLGVLYTCAAPGRPSRPQADHPRGVDRILSLPSGTVTFLFTDIEGSTRRWDEFGAAMNEVMAHHDTLLSEIVERHNGAVFKTVGDAICAVFERPADAASAALEMQRELQHSSWDNVGGLMVRMGIHTGSAFARDRDYFGPVVNRVARIVSAAHGQQILVSQGTADLIADNLPSGVELRDLGEHRLKDLARPERLFQLNEPNLPRDFPPLRSLDWHPNNLPTQLTTLVGRQHEIAVARELLLERNVRLVTLTGPGGVGKTHLALQIAADLLDDFRDGAFWIPLATVVDASLLLSAIATTVGVRELQGVSLQESVVSALRDKHMLLVLDNAEHVLSAATDIATLLAACPQLHMLVTSRALLRLYGEHDLRIEPLSVPAESRRRTPSLEELMSYEAINLFSERARAVRPEFNITEANADAIAELCRKLDGLPLAIELAAAQVRLLSPQATLARINAGPGSSSQLRVIGHGPRDLPSRHQSLGANIAWSHDLLDDDERALFRRMAVFAGSAGFEAIERVCGHDAKLDSLDTLASLVDKSLVRVDELADEPRYRMLETIRAFAHEKLDESGETERTQIVHLQYFLEFGEYAEQHWWGPEQANLLERLQREQDNIRAALRWCLDSGDVETGLRLASSIWRFWEARGRLREGRNAIERLLAGENGNVSDPVRARALSGLGILAFRQGDYDAAREAQEQSLALRRQLGTVSGIAMSLSHLGDIARQLGELDQARVYYEESLQLRRSIGYRTGVAISLTKLALIVRLDGDLQKAQELLEEALVIHRAVGNRSWEAAVLNYMGRIAFYRADAEGARALHIESLEIRRETGERWETAMALCHLGDAEMQLGNLVGAQSALVQSLRHWHELGDTWGVAYALESLGYLAQKQDDIPLSIRLFAASARAREQLKSPPSAAGRARLDRALEACRRVIGEDECERIWNQSVRDGPSELIRQMLETSAAWPMTG
jgi:predicted ATPase/class 3 adenylate cyclase